VGCVKHDSNTIC